MKKRDQMESAFFLGDEKRADEDIEEAQTRVTRQLFEQGFRGLFQKLFDQSDPAQKLLAQLSPEQMDGFFIIADRYLRELAGTPKTKAKRALLADYRRCEELMAGTENQISGFREYAQGFLTPGPSRTGPVALRIITRLDSLAKKLESDFYAIRHSIDIQEDRIPQLLVKNLTDDFVMNLEVFIGNEFSTLDRKNKDVLIAAALAGAGVFTQRELKKGEDLLGRIPMKVSRARKHFQKQITDNPTFDGYCDPPGRVFPILKARKKKQ